MGDIIFELEGQRNNGSQRWIKGHCKRLHLNQRLCVSSHFSYNDSRACNSFIVGVCICMKFEATSLMQISKSVKIHYCWHCMEWCNLTEFFLEGRKHYPLWVKALQSDDCWPQTPGAHLPLTHLATDSFIWQPHSLHILSNNANSWIYHMGKYTLKGPKEGESIWQNESWNTWWPQGLT